MQERKRFILQRVSIHAPTRGATPSTTVDNHVLGVSIHAPTRGATNLHPFNFSNYGFQSTHPHGVRHLPTEVEVGQTLFQSTHPHGVRRYRPTNGGEYIRVSIHAPTRGATSFTGFSRFDDIVSIHAPTRGATVTLQHTKITRYVSIHAPTRGAT